MERALRFAFPSYCDPVPTLWLRLQLKQKSMGSILNWVYHTPISQTIRIRGFFVPILFLHFLSSMFVVVSISKVDLRLMGIAYKRKPVSELLEEFLPWTWWSFAIAAISGLLMFIAKAPSFYNNVSFEMMILFIGCAGVNMWVFQTFTYRSIAKWDSNGPTAFAAKVAGGLSLVFWLAAAAFGFSIGFFISPFR